jgi:uncharacterized protein (DUF1697 family)
MPSYAAFLRGINVGGKHRVRMDALRGIFDGLGLTGARTYIQSGNVVFAAEEPEDALRARLEAELESVLGFPVPVILRTAAELDDLLAGYPFSATRRRAAAAATDAETEYVCLWNAPLSAEALTGALAGYVGPDQWASHGRDLYLLLFQSVRDAKLVALITKALPPATARNLHTLAHVAALAHEME